MFASVTEQYFSIDYNGKGIYSFNPISGELIGRTKKNEEFDQYDEHAYMNIIIKYMNKSKIDSNILPLLESIDFKPSVDMFYCIPMIIYVLENSVKNLMS